MKSGRIVVKSGLCARVSDRHNVCVCMSVAMCVCVYVWNVCVECELTCPETYPVTSLYKAQLDFLMSTDSFRLSAICLFFF